MSPQGPLRRLAVLATLSISASVLPVVPLPAGKAPEVVQRALDLRGPGVIRAPIGFGLLGVTWPKGELSPAGMRVRTSEDGVRWSGWSELDSDEVDLGPDPGAEGSAVRSTTPLWVGHARFVDVRPTGPLPRGARLHVIDPGPDPKAPASSAAASPSQPGIITRSQWGADESIRRCCTAYASSLKAVIIHHTATGNSYGPGDSAAIVRSIYAYHVQSNGWDDIGYNFLVDRHGQIFEGRAGGITRAVIGAHAQGFNTGTSGMAVIGTFSSTGPPAAAWNALRHLVSWRLDVNHLDPLASVVMTSGGSSKWPAGQNVTLPRLSAHRDVGTTSCPGEPFYNSLGALRNEVAGHGDPKLVSPTRSRPIITPNGDGVADTVEISALFSSPDVSWKVDVVDALGKIWRSFTGTGSRLFVSWDGRANGSRVPHDVYSLNINGSNGRGVVRPTTIRVNVWVYPNGTLFRTTSRWLGVLEKGKLRPYLTRYAAYTRNVPSEEVNVPDELLSSYPMGRTIGFRNGSIVRADSKLWIISDALKRPVSQSTLDGLGYSSDAIIETNASYLAPHPSGPTVTTTGGHPNGTALKSSDLREGVIRSGQVRPLPTRNVRLSLGIRDVELVGPADAQMVGAQANPPMGFRDGSLLRSSSTNIVYAIADGRQRRISSRHRLDAMRYNRDSIRIVSEAELALHPEGSAL